MSSHYPEPLTFGYNLYDNSPWNALKSGQTLTKQFGFDPGTHATLLLRGFQLVSSRKFGRIQTYTCYNNIERQIGTNSVTFTLEQAKLLPQEKYGGVPIETRRSLAPQDGWDQELNNRPDSAATQELLSEYGNWRIFFTIIPASIAETTTVGNFELNFISQAAVYKEVATNYIRDFVDNAGIQIPNAHKIFIVGSQGFAKQADFSRKLKLGYNYSKDVAFVQDRLSTVPAQDKDNQIAKIEGNKGLVGLNAYCRSYRGTWRLSPLQPSNVSFMFLSQQGRATIAHEFVHAFPIHPDAPTPSPHGKTMKDFYKASGPVGYYKNWAGNPNLTEIPIEDTGHNLPANSDTLKVVNPFVVIGDIPYPVPFGLSSYARGGLKYAFLEYAYLKEQDGTLMSKPIEDFAPEDKSVFKTSLCNNLVWEFQNLQSQPMPPSRFVTNDVKDEFQKMEQTKCYFLLFLSCYGFFPTVPRPSDRKTIIRTGTLFAAFERAYKDEYDLPYSDTNLKAINNGSVILFKTDSVSPEVLDNPFTSRADTSRGGAVNYYSNHSSTVLEYVGFRYVEEIVTVMNGEILRRVLQSGTPRIPGALSNDKTDLRYDNLIVSQKTADEYDADGGIPAGIDDIIESYFGGERCRQKLEIEESDGSISCEEYYIIVAHAPSSSGFTSYTLTDPYENIQADVLIP